MKENITIKEALGGIAYCTIALAIIYLIDHLINS